MKSVFDRTSYEEMLNDANDLLNKANQAEQAAEDELFKLRVNNAEELARLKIDLINKEKKKELEAQTRADARILALEASKEKKKKAYLAKLAKNTKLSPDERKKLEKDAEEKFKIEEKVKDKILKQEKNRQKRADAIERQREYKEAGAEMGDALFGKGKSFTERIEGLTKAFTDDKGNKSFLKGISALTAALADMAQKLDATVNEIANSRSSIDTRLQGSKNATLNGSYWQRLSSDITSNIGASALVKQSDIITSLKNMVGVGIAFNVEQRAFLDTISDKIATTFEATDGTLLKLIRIQQEDTTAARLGMESALTAFLNNMYETTEYMQSAASDIRASLYEASTLMTAKSATEFEYQVQKWMGSLYSVGFGSTSGLAGALGKLAAGDISSISSGGFGNLLVMAANRANMSVSDILAEGLDSSSTNKLLQAMVAYLGQIYANTGGSNLLAQQYASVFGLSASDLRAAANLSGSLSSISGNSLGYGGMLSQLSGMAGSMYSRMSLGELMGNAWDNFQYSLASGIANNPALYSMYKIAGLLDSTGAGLNFSTGLFAGTGSAQTFNVADLLQTAALGGSILGGMGSMLGGLFGNGETLLSNFGINGNSVVVARGQGKNLLTSGGSTSESGYAANSASADITSKIMTDTYDEETKKIEAAEEASTAKTLANVDDSIIKIYDMLSAIVTGNGMKVVFGSEGPWNSSNGSAMPF